MYQLKKNPILSVNAFIAILLSQQCLRTSVFSSNSLIIYLLFIINKKQRGLSQLNSPVQKILLIVSMISDTNFKQMCHFNGPIELSANHSK
jgi:hypothetical protein